MRSSKLKTWRIFLFFCAITTGLLMTRSALAENSKKSLATDAADNAYMIGSGDEMDITVLGYPELTTKTSVLPDGFISFPYIGRIRAEGETISSLTRNLQDALDAFIYHPQVILAIPQTRSKRFSVLGEVRQPGVFALDDMNITIYEAIAHAQGFQNTAFKQQVSVMRPDQDGHQTSVIIDMTDSLAARNRAFDIKLRPGDIVYVPGPSDSRQVSVIGKVVLPGRYNFSMGMTVVDVLTAAGWVAKGGAADSVMLVRRAEDENIFMRINAQQVVSKADFKQDLPLQPGDIIFVPDNFISKIQTFVSYFTSTIEPIATTYLRVYDAVNPSSYVVER